MPYDLIALHMVNLEIQFLENGTGISGTVKSTTDFQGNNTWKHEVVSIHRFGGLAEMAAPIIRNRILYTMTTDDTVSQYQIMWKKTMAFRGLWVSKRHGHDVSPGELRGKDIQMLKFPPAKVQKQTKRKSKWYLAQ
jgi:hypothetical protein